MHFSHVYRSSRQNFLNAKKSLDVEEVKPLLSIDIGDSLTIFLDISGNVTNEYDFCRNSVNLDVISKLGDSAVIVRVPQYVYMGNSFKATDKVIRKYKLDKRWLNEYIAIIPINQIISVSKNDGCTCIKCNNFFPYAEPNGLNGINKIFTCYTCRNNI